jgi:hypothetical protein
MKNFLAFTWAMRILRIINSGCRRRRPRRKSARMPAWFAWGEKHKAAIVENGAPLGKTKRASRAGLSDTKNSMTGYTVVQADSHEAAARMFENHPHFTIFPGDSVEIMECLPLPAQK